MLGIGFGLALTVAATIGVGILRTPGEIAAYLPNPLLFMGVWILGGLYSLLGAAQVAELGTALPRSGGFYVFTRRALGPYAGFVVGWSDWLSSCGSLASAGIVLGEYLAALFPALSNYVPHIAVSTVLLFSALQWRGVRMSSGTQQITTLLKALVFIGLIVAIFTLGGQAHEATSTQPAPQTSMSLLLFAPLILAMQSVIFTYDGWYGVIYCSEEMRNGERTIPRSIFGGVLSVIAIYLLFNIALIYVLPLSALAGEKLAAAAAARAIFGSRGDTIISAVAAVSMLSSINAFQIGASRVLFAMSRDGLFTQKAARVSEAGTPRGALLVSTIVAVLFIILSGTFARVLAMVSFFFVANYAMTYLSVFILRKREPELPRPYRAWGYPWTTALALLGSIAFLAGSVKSDTENSIYALIMLAASYPVYLLIMSKNRTKKRALLAFASGSAITSLPLLVLLVLKVSLLALKIFHYSDALDRTTFLDRTTLWIVFWPMAITWFILPRSTPMSVNITVGIIFTVLLYSSVIYLLMKWRGKP